MRNCVICGIDISHKVRNAKTCSDMCRVEKDRANNAKWRKNNPEYRKNNREKARQTEQKHKLKLRAALQILRELGIQL